ncbi:MAG: RdgB/HAM1 family non-canonical purine NTP pyrophosphatase [Microthrixaceae bacterium]
MKGFPATIVLATTNDHKAAELAEVLEEAGIRTRVAAHGAELQEDGFVTLLTRPGGVPAVEETAPDFEGNARLKAWALADATGLPALADDSGLEVDHLGGAPGVRSARFAGEDADDLANVSRLLGELEELEEGDPRRRARFRCVVVLAIPGEPPVVASGTVEGRIVAEPRGAAGFGYDPVFVPDGADGRTFAEMSAPEKNAISHRGRALRSLVTRLGRS